MQFEGISPAKFIKAMAQTGHLKERDAFYGVKSRNLLHLTF
jgi:hypothetical protein